MEKSRSPSPSPSPIEILEFNSKLVKENSWLGETIKRWYTVKLRVRDRVYELKGLAIDIYYRLIDLLESEGFILEDECYSENTGGEYPECYIYVVDPRTNKTILEIEVEFAGSAPYWIYIDTPD